MRCAECEGKAVSKLLWLSRLGPCLQHHSHHSLHSHTRTWLIVCLSVIFSAGISIWQILDCRYVWQIHMMAMIIVIIAWREVSDKFGPKRAQPEANEPSQPAAIGWQLHTHTHTHMHTNTAKDTDTAKLTDTFVCITVDCCRCCLCLLWQRAIAA